MSFGRVSESAEGMKEWEKGSFKWTCRFYFAFFSPRRDSLCRPAESRILLCFSFAGVSAFLSVVLFCVVSVERRGGDRVTIDHIHPSLSLTRTLSPCVLVCLSVCVCVCVQYKKLFPLCFDFAPSLSCFKRISIPTHPFNPQSQWKPPTSPRRPTLPASGTVLFDDIRVDRQSAPEQAWTDRQTDRQTGCDLSCWKEQAKKELSLFAYWTIFNGAGSWELILPR